MSVDMFGNDPAMSPQEMIDAGLIDEQDNLTRWGHMMMAKHSTWDDECFCWVAILSYDDKRDVHGPFRTADDASEWYKNGPFVATNGAVIAPVWTVES